MSISPNAARLFTFLMAAALAVAPAAGAATPELISTSSSEEIANAGSGQSEVSADGRFVVFESQASNLVPGDTNNEIDVFIRDRPAGTTELVGLSSSGGHVPGGVWLRGISADARYVAFGSLSSGVVPGDTNNDADVFVRDRLLGTTERVSVDSAEQQANGASPEVDISADGQFVAFTSYAPNLVPGDTNDQGDVFLRDRVAGTTVRVSVDSARQQANGSPGQHVAISDDGRFVAFESYASNLVPGDGNGTLDVFVHEVATGATERVDVSSGGDEAIGGGSLEAINADGRFVVFDSGAPNLVEKDTNDPNQPDVFVRDRATGQTERVSIGNQGEEADSASFGSAISDDGRVVAFSSGATTLVPGDTNGLNDAFVRDRTAGATERVSVGGGGEEGNGHSGASALNGDGSLVAFVSGASNFVAGDTNGAFDIFVATHDLTVSTPDCFTSNRAEIVAQDGGRARINGRAETGATGPPTGSESYVVRGGAGERIVMRSTSIDTLLCSDRDATILGQALVNGEEAGFEIDLHDGGGRRNDTYRLRLSTGYDSGAQTLISGNVSVR
jgi:Tol biopolymer transport system component